MPFKNDRSKASRNFYIGRKKPNASFSTQEITLMCLYEGKNRLDTIRELKHMMKFLDEDEKELHVLTEGTIQKLKQMTDEEYKSFSLHYLIL